MDGFLLMGTADMLTLAQWRLVLAAQNHQRFALLMDLTCLVLGHFDVICLQRKTAPHASLLKP